LSRDGKVRSIFFLITGAFMIFALGGCARKIVVPSGTIVFLGDSITAGYGLDPAEAYPALIEIKGMTMHNLGLSGSTSRDGLQRLKDYFNGGGEARLVVIALGANDILRGISAEETEANLGAAIAECRSRGIPVMICGIWIPGQFGTADRFKKIASDNHVPLLPDLMQGEETQDTLLQDDHMHPMAEGQKIIAEKLQAALLESFSFGP
jgi:acyl-CoA thioesterase I